MAKNVPAFAEQVELIAQQVVSDPDTVKAFRRDAKQTIAPYMPTGLADRAELEQAVLLEIPHRLKLEATASRLAEQIATSPGLRTTYFKDASAAFADVAPKPIVFNRAGGAYWEQLKSAVLQKVPDEIYTRAPMEAAADRADRIQDKFFSAAIRNPERSFDTILNASIATFAVGLGLIIAGTYLGFTANDTTREIVISSVFTGTGVAGVLGTIYSLIRRGIRLSNANHAQIRVFLTAFSFELSRLLAYDPDKDDLKKTQNVNRGIREAMVKAVELLQDNVKVEENIKATGTTKDANSAVTSEHDQCPTTADLQKVADLAVASAASQLAKGAQGNGGQPSESN